MICEMLEQPCVGGDCISVCVFVCVCVCVIVIIPYYYLTQIHPHTYILVHTYIHTYTHTYSHGHIHTTIHTCMYSVRILKVFFGVSSSSVYVGGCLIFIKGVPMPPSSLRSLSNKLWLKYPQRIPGVSLHVYHWVYISIL